jgi:parvulin-like peptidyl-prolyl isomerase
LAPDAPVRAAKTAHFPSARPTSPPADVVAVVNGEKILRKELAAECVNHYGNDVLESLVNKRLIEEHCKRQRITVSDEELNAEINTLAQRFGVPVDKWLSMLKEERGINPEQYRRDIIWPTVALRKLAADRLEVTKEELQQAYETEFGPQVKVRMIGIRSNAKKAAEAHRAAKANPKAFGKVAVQYSEDAESASANGWIQPIRMHAGEKAIEEAAFALKEGEVSNVIKVGEQYIILYCEGTIPARPTQFEQVADKLADMMKEKKLRGEAAELFKQLQAKAKVVNVLNDEKKKKEMPGVAATINGQPITLSELSKECLARHARDTLNGLVNRRLIEQELRKRSIRLTEQDINDEIDEAAARMIGVDKTTGRVEEKQREAWLKQVTSEPGVTVALYVRDAVWPSVAMKALCKSQVKLLEQDLKDAFEANYGPRVRCAAIVVDDQRKAQNVWKLVRDNPTREYFGEMAAKHSTDPSVSALRGEIPPIGKHCGRPLLEKAAFELADGELSPIIQTDGKFVILLCEGRTSPEAVTLEDVRSDLYDHVYRVKLNDAMGKMFDQMQQTAEVTNYIDPSASRKPKLRSATERTATRAGSATPKPTTVR